MADAHPLVSEEIMKAVKLAALVEIAGRDCQIMSTAHDVAEEVARSLAPLLCAAQRERDARIADAQADEDRQAMKQGCDRRDCMTSITTAKEIAAAIRRNGDAP